MSLGAKGLKLLCELQRSYSGESEKECWLSYSYRDTLRYNPITYLEGTWIIMKNSWLANLQIKNQIQHLPNKKQEY